MGLEVANAPTQVPRDIVLDMPDRVTAATALHLELPLVTRDERIRSLRVHSIWWSPTAPGVQASPGA